MIATYMQNIRLFSRDVRLYLISWAIVGFNHMGIITVLFNLYLLRLGHGPQFIGVVNGAAWIAFTVACLVSGMVGKRWTSRTSMVAGMLVVTLGVGLVLLAEKLPDGWQQGWIVTSYSLSWIGAAFYMVSSMPFLTRSTSGEERNHAFAIRTALNNVSALIGSLVAGILPGFFAVLLQSSLDKTPPYRYSLWVACALYGVAVFVLLGTRKAESTPVEEDKQADPTQVAANSPSAWRLILLFALVILLTNSGSAVISNFFNVYLDSDLAIPTLGIGALSAAKQLLSVMLALTAPLLMARWGKHRTILFSCCVLSLSMLPLALIAHWAGAGLGYIGGTAMTSLMLPAFGVYQQESVPPKWRVTMSGAINTATGISGAMMAYGGAMIITTWGYRQLFLVAACLVALGAVIFWGHTQVARKPLVDHR